MHNVNLNLHENAKLVTREVIIFWEKALIPVREEYHFVKKLESLNFGWRNLQKHTTRKLVNDRKIEEEFVNKFDDIFEIGHVNALNIIKIESDKQFLIAQKKKGRSDCMLRIDKKTQNFDKRVQRLKSCMERIKIVYEETETLGI